MALVILMHLTENAAFKQLQYQFMTKADMLPESPVVVMYISRQRLCDTL